MDSRTFSFVILAWLPKLLLRSTALFLLVSASLTGCPTFAATPIPVTTFAPNAPHAGFGTPVPFGVPHVLPRSAKSDNKRKRSYAESSSCDYYGCTYYITASEFETIPFFLAGQVDDCGEPQSWVPASGASIGGGIVNQGPSNGASSGTFSFQIQPGSTGASFQVGELTNGGFCEFSPAYYINPFVEAIFFIGVPARAPSLDINQPYCPLCQASTGDPMDVVSGAFWEKKTDLQMPGPFGLSFTRFYGSEMPDSGDLGSHWSDNFSDSEFIYTASAEAAAQASPGPTTASLRSRNAGTRKRDIVGSYVENQSYYLDPEQMPHYYGPGGGYDPITGTTLSEDPSGNSATLSFFDGRSLHFDAAGKLVKRTDRIGNTQTIIRNSSEQIQSVQDSLGRQLCFYYNSGDSRIASVGEWFSSASCPASVASTSAHVNYTYDSGNDPSGNQNCTTTQLCAVTEPDGRIWTYGYDIANATSNMTAIYDPLGNPEVVNTYSGYALATQHRGTAGQIGGNLQFTYPEPLPTSPSDPLGHTQVTNPDTGEVTDFYFNQQAMITSKSGKLCDCHGYQSAAYAYDQYDRLLSESDSGNTYAPSGQITTGTGTISIGSGATPSPTSHVISYAYGRDTNGLAYPGPTSISENLNASGASRTQLISYYPISDPRQDLPRTIERPSVDSLGQMKTTTFTFSMQGLLTEKDDTGYVQGSPVTHASKMTYDARGRMLSSILARTDVNTTSTVSYFADSDPDLMRAGQVSGTTDALGHQNNIIATANGTYDAYGDPLSSVDSNGVMTTATYDSWGRVLSTTISGVPGDPLKLVETNVYDGAGRLVGHTRPLGNGTSETLDSSDRVIATTRIDASGNQYERSTIGYDSADEMISQAAQGCAQPSTLCTNWTTTTASGYGYDSFGELDEVDDAPTNTLNSTIIDKKFIGYTNQGRPAVAFDENHMLEGSLTCGAGQLTVDAPVLGPTSAGLGSSQLCVLNYGWSYDLAGRALTAQRFLPAATINPETNYTYTNYAYDTDDNVSAVTDPNGNVTTYHFDDFGNMLTESSPVSGTTNYTYDLDDNLIATQDATGARTSYVYDALERPKSSVSVKASMPTENVSWTYDDPTPGNFGIGRLSSMSDPAGTTSYAYDRRGLLAMDRRVLDGNIFTQRYAYDANGNRSMMTYSDGLTLAYGYDYADRPYSITQIASGTRSADERPRARFFGDNTSRKRLTGHIVPSRVASRATPQQNLAPVAIVAPQIMARTRGRSVGAIIERVPASVHPRERLDAQARRALLVLREIGSISQIAKQRRLTRDLSVVGGTTIVASTTYAPFGPMINQLFGNGTTQTMLIDARYRPMANELTNAAGTALANLQYTEDSTGNVTAISDLLDPRFSRAFVYDDMNRLTASVTGPAANVIGVVGNQSLATATPSPSTAIGLWGAAVYQYDRMGNMTVQQIGQRVDDFRYSGTTSKLTSVVATSTVGGSVSYDAAGNETAVGLNAYKYSARNEMVGATGPTYTDLVVPSIAVGSASTVSLNIGNPWSYRYDGFGTRLATTINQLSPSVTTGSIGTIPSVSLFKQPTRYSIPGPNGELATETSTTNVGVPEYDYIWMDNKPIAQIDGTGTHYDFTDHLETPVIQTDSTGAISYQADYEPFGKIYDIRGLENPHQPLRLPGQVAEQFTTSVLGLPVNTVTDLAYNSARWYRPEWGQYSQSDPFGIVSSPRLYERAHVHKLSKVHALKEFDSASTALYSYGSNSPEARVDPTGLADFKVWGNYCGPGYTAGKHIPTDALTYDQWKVVASGAPPFDALDRCCEDHDGKYVMAAHTSTCPNHDRRIADFQLAECAVRVMEDIQDGTESDPRNPWHTYEEYLAAEGIAEYMGGAQGPLGTMIDEHNYPHGDGHGPGPAPLP